MERGQGRGAKRGVSRACALHHTSKGDCAPGKGTIVLCSAGTSDQPVAEEAAVTAEILGNTVDRHLRRRRGRHSSRARATRSAGIGARRDCRGRHGRRAAERGRRHGRRAGDRGADEHRLRRQLRRRRGAARHAELVRERRIGREHRQRLWRRLHRVDDQSPDWTQDSRPLDRLQCSDHGSVRAFNDRITHSRIRSHC